MESSTPPIVSKDPHAELTELLELGLQLQIKLVEMQRRMREVHQQIVQGRMEEREDSANSPP